MTKDEQWLLEEKYQGEKCAAFFADCARLEAGVPLAYVIGSIPFLDCTIYLDSKPLIPRPETEHWTEEAIITISTVLDQASRKPSPKRLSGELDSCLSQDGADGDSLAILDLCAGSGCIGTAVLKAIPNIHVDFAELESKHQETIQKNLLKNTIDPTRTNIYIGDLFQSVPAKKYDVILSNPPYIDPAIDRTEVSVTAFEPHTALYGGTEGIELIREIIKTSPAYLNPQGQVWIEHEPEQSKEIQTLGNTARFTVTAHKDQYDIERYSILVLQ